MLPSEKTVSLSAFDWSTTSLGPISEWPEELEFSTNIISASPLPMMILWGEESISIYNDAYADLVGSKHPDLFGKPFQEIWPEMENFSNEVINTCFYNGESKTFDNQPFKVSRNNRNENLWINVHCSPITDKRKVSAGVLMVFVDQSEKVLSIQRRKRMEEALKESEDQYRAIVDCIPQIIWTTKPDGYHDYYNRRWYDFVGKSFSETKGQNWSAQFHPDDQDRARKRYQHSLETGEPYEIEYRLRAKDGSYKWFLGQAMPLRDEKTGQIIRWFGTCTDIHELKMAQAALAKSEERLSRIIEGSNDGIWEWDFKNDKAWWNDRFNEIIGRNIPENERSYGSVLPFIPEEDKNILPMAVDMFLKGLGKLEVVYRLIRPNGEIRHLLSKGKGVLDAAGNVTMLSGTITDITEQKQWEENLRINNEQLTRINNDLDNFIYTASHDLRSPIANIEGLMRLLSTTLDLESNQEVKKINSLILFSIERFKQIIKDLTEVAKVSGTQEEVCELSFSEILDEIKLNIQGLIDESQAQITDDFSEAPNINFSPKNMRSIIYNLVSNAIKYRSPDRPVKVKVTTTREANYILLCVEDNGMGIREKDHEKVFQMFKRVHTHVEGTGIGLAIVKKIVDNNGGKIELESEEGKGTTFRIYLKV